LGKTKPIKATLWPKYPPQIEDITLTIPPQTKIGEVIEVIKSTNKLVYEVELKDVYDANYTFRIYYQHPQKTLDNKEVETVRKQILQKLKNKFKIEVN
jgi:phenylalanyl-tRNA synthetase beta subunit